jgi:hypothetical protein
LSADVEFCAPGARPRDGERVPTAGEWQQFRRWCADMRPDLNRNPAVVRAAALFRRTLTESVLNIAVAKPGEDEGGACWRVYIRFASTPELAHLYCIDRQGVIQAACASLRTMHPDADITMLDRPLAGTGHA